MGWSTNDGRKNRHTGSECASVWLSVCMCAFMSVECVHCMCHVCLCVWLSHISATSHAGVSASQARIEDTPCYFIIYQSMLYEGSWCNVPPRGFYFWNNTLWHVHVNKCVIYYYLIQSLCFCCQLLNHANDSTHEAFTFTIFNSLEAWKICPGNDPPAHRKGCILHFLFVMNKTASFSYDSCKGWKTRASPTETHISSKDNSMKKMDLPPYDSTVYKIKSQDTNIIF